MRKWLFFSSFMKPGKEWGGRMLCLWSAELLFVVGGASVYDWWSFCWRKTKPSFGGDLKVLFVVKNGHFAERFVERFFLSVNSCMIGSYLRFEKSGERKVEYIINNKR